MMSGTMRSKSKETSFMPSDGFSMTSEYRDATSIFEKFERYDLQENLALHSTNWLLSHDDFKMSIDPPSGICKNLKTMTHDMIIVLFPYDEETDHLDYREVFQLIRELAVGMYGCNQFPSLELESNFDRSTVCQMPTVYMDTRLGQHLINADYMMKGLWHGAYFPKEKRLKWNERWKRSLDVNFQGVAETKRNIFEEFCASGLVSISDDPDYQNAYKDYSEMFKHENIDEISTKAFFKSKLSSIGMKINFFPNFVAKHENIFLLNSDWKIETTMRTVGEDLDNEKTELLCKILRLHRDIISNNLGNKKIVRRSLYILSLICSLIPLFVALKKKMKVPDITKLMNPLTGDDVVTEKELPPLVTGENFPNKLFRQTDNDYFPLHGGIQFDLDTPDFQEFPADMKENDSIKNILHIANEALLIAQSESTYIDENPVRTVNTDDGKKYYVIPIMLETYFNQAPKKPNWVRALSEETIKLQQKKLLLSDNAMYEQFKTFFGLDAAIKNKNIMEGLKTCSKRGLVAMIQTLCRKCSVTRVSKQDELGWSLMHHASMNNKFHLIGSLILQSQDVNVRRYNTVTETSPTPLHVATISGSLNAVACLVGCGSNLRSADKSGWMPIHCAAFYDQVVILKLLIRRDTELKDVPTRNTLKSTPILLAAGAGSLETVKTLMSLCANMQIRDTENKGVVHMAVLSVRTKILDYFIELNDKRVSVWPVFLEMLQNQNEQFVYKAVQCLQLMTRYCAKYWENLLSSRLIPALVNLLTKDNLPLLLETTMVLCNICTQPDVQKELSQTDIVKISIQLFEMDSILLQSQAAFIIGSMCSIQSCQELFAQLKGYLSLTKMISEATKLDETLVLVNGVEALDSLCRENSENQNLIVQQTSFVDYLIRFLSMRNKNDSDRLLASSSLAISSIVKNNRQNQDVFIRKSCAEPLLELLKHRSNVKVQVAAANAVEHLSSENENSRAAFLSIETEKSLILLLKIWSVEVKEQGIRSLWSLAGAHISGQRFIADRIGPSLLIELIMAKSETLQTIGCCAISALCREVKVKQDLILNEGGILPLVRLLKFPSSSDNVLKTTVTTLGVLCIGVAHRNNSSVQSQIAQESAFQILAEIFERPTTDIVLKIEIAYTIAALTLNHKENQQLIENLFDFCVLLELIPTIEDKNHLLRCLTSLTVFCFNNTMNQFAIRKAGGLDYSIFEEFIESDDEIQQCQAAFNMVVLARDMITLDQVTVTAIAVRKLVENLKCEKHHVIILTASLVASLCHTRAGIPDAFVSLDTVHTLLQLLNSPNAEVRASVAVALGYISFNGTAARFMLKECRKDYSLFKKFTSEIKKMDSKISKEFVETYLRTEKIGLPYKYLESNGGYPINPSPTRFRVKSSVSRNTTSVGPRSQKQSKSSMRPATAFTSTKYKF